MKTPTCLVVGSMPMDVLARRRVPPAKGADRFYVHVGHTAGNVATMLAAQYGWRTLPVAHFDGFGWGGRLREDLARYGADVGLVTTGGDRGTTFFVETHKTGRDGHPAVGRETRVPRGGRFSSYRLLTRETARALLDGPLAGAPPPDVLFFTEPVAGHRLVAEGLRARGTFVYFEPPKRMSPRELASGIAVADVVKFSNEDYPDASFAEGLAGKLAVQTMKGEGVRFNLRGAGWRTVPPVANPNFLDGEGAGDWTSSALLAALGRRGLPRVADLDEATVEACLREAQQTASRSVGFLGSKGMLEDRYPTPPAWLDPAQDPAPPPPVPPKPAKAPPPPADCGRSGAMFSPPTPFAEKKGWTVFLGGPIGGAPEWQRSVPKLAEELGLEGVAWLNPRGRHLPHRPQVEWETHGLRVCDYVLFWIPKPAKTLSVDDKPYALTTRMELAENLVRGNRIVLGIDPDVPWTRHAKFLAERYGVKVRTTLEDCLRALKRELARRRPAERDVDGPAWVAETLARGPACVDDLARDQLLVERWNHEFAPDDTIRVRGGLPVDPAFRPLLNGDIRLLGE